MSYQDSLSDHRERWSRALAGRANWTREAWIDMRIASNKAWTPDELEIFRAQRREPSNYPIIHPVIEATCGIEAQTRSDIKMAARIEAHMDTAEALTHINKFIDDQNKTARHRSKAFRAAVTTGIGWLEVGKNPDPFEEQILKRSVSPFDVWLDPTSREDDLSDAQDMFRARWVTPAWLALTFPHLEGEIPGTSTGPSAFDPLSHTADYTNQHGDRPPVSLMNNAFISDPMMGPGHGVQAPYLLQGYAQQDGDYIFRPNRYEGLVLAVERWYRADEIALVCRFRNGVVLEAKPENHHVIARAVVRDGAKLMRKVVRRMRCAIFTDDCEIQDEASDLAPGEFPLIPYWAYRDEEHQPLGIVRLLRDTVREFNSRKTHLTKRLVQRQTHYEEGAFVDEDEALSELARFNGAVKYTEGALRNGAVVIKEQTQTMQGEIDMVQNTLEIAQNLTGTTQELLGQQTNATSGVAIQQRSQQGQTSLYSLFEARNWAQQQEGEQTLALIQQLYTEEQEVRITGSTRGLKYITINKMDPQKGMLLNDVSQGRYDVVVSEQPASPTERAANVQGMSNIIAKLPPEMQLEFVAELAEAQDMDIDFIEKLDALVKKIQSQPPAAAPPPPPPPKKSAGEVLKVDSGDLTRNQLAQVLQDEWGIAPDPQGVTPNEQAQQAARKPQADPSQPDPTKMALQAQQLAHDATQAHLDRQHEARQSVADKYHEALMAGAGVQADAALADQGHQQGLEMASHQADLAPEPPPRAGASS